MVRDAIAPSSELRLLDAAGGTGVLREACSPCGFYSFDLVMERVKNVRASDPDAGAFVGDVTRLAAADKCFDRVLATGLFHHLDDEQSILAVEEFHRVLKDDGRVVVLDAIWPINSLNLFGYMMRKMDEGKYVRNEEPLKDILLTKFKPVQAGKFSSRWLDYTLMVLEKR
ncbi:MAG: class I SAM-dependent methyltransferase [Nitrospinota bacterium]|nr:class I SAM-dependent methyltransferase [Nitrospinota bacterium]